MTQPSMTDRIGGPIGNAPKGGRFAAAGGLLGALAASSCCLLPLTLFSLGVGGAWLGGLTALAPFQPLFVTPTFALLGWGYWLAYYRPRRACASGACGQAGCNRTTKGCCGPPPSSWPYPWRSPISPLWCAMPDATRRNAIAVALAMAGLWTSTATAAERSVTLAVENMSCAACPIIVKRTLAGIDGVRQVTVSFESKTAVVTFDDAVTNPAALAQATASVGYPSRLLDRSAGEP